MINMPHTLRRWLTPGSSPVDWCEENYALSGAVAELTNTLSSLPLLLLPITCLTTHVWDSFTHHVSRGAHLEMYLMLAVGISSIYVHSTLSLLGQMFDEISIVWALFIGYSYLIPNQHRPKFYFGNNAHVVSVCIATALTCAWVVFPYLNGFVLMTLSLPVLWIHGREITKHKNPATLRITAVTTVLLTFAIFFWMADFFFCGFCRALRIPGLHSMWHLLVSVGAYLTITVFAYRKAASDAPSVVPSIRHLTGHWWGIPYVHCVKKHALLSPETPHLSEKWPQIV